MHREWVYDQCGSLVLVIVCIYMCGEKFTTALRREIYHSLAARDSPQMVCGEIFFGWLRRAPLGGALTRNFSIGEVFGLSEGGKGSQKTSL